MAKTAAQRKAEQRKRQAEHLKAVGAEAFNMTMYRGTREALDQLKQEHGFDNDAEIVTLLFHNLANCDKSRTEELLKVPQIRKAA